MKFIPEVKSCERLSDTSTKIEYIGINGCSLSQEVVDDFRQFCNLSDGQDNIFFTKNEDMQDGEYSISINNGEVIIKSSSQSGEVYALQTLKQILFQTKFCPFDLEIADKPSMKIRGFMLDVGRYFYSVEEVKAIIRRMALHKLNLLHLHLTEDQGWRVEIEAYPLLTIIGSHRACTNFNNVSHGGFYTKQDIKEIVDYAHCFAIKVMPEFDIPGHSRAAIAAYNELTCFPRDLPVATHWGVKHDVLCVGKESTMQFVYKVIDELCEMFPDEYFHIGGDEVPKQRWNACEHCQGKIKELGLKDSDELQFRFMNNVKNYLKDKGKQAFMWSWDIKSSNGLDEDLGFTMCDDANVNGNRPFIDTCTKAYYIDLPYGYISLKDCASHKTQCGNCLGVEATLWTEYVKDMKKADIMTFPRLAPICDMGWNEKTSYEEIENKLDFYYDYLDKNEIGYAKINKANPNPIRKLFGILWFEKRQLTWEGLTNLIWDKKFSKKQ